MNADLRARLEAIVGEGYVSACAESVDGVAPSLLARPGTQEEAALVVRACAGASAAVIPRGGGTAMGMGNAPARADVLLGLERLDRVVEWDPANLVISAEAGMRLEALQALAAKERTILPLDPPGLPRVTLGGLVAANQSGPSRLQFGTVRDWVLGMRVVLPDGERIHCGGRVIKNVSGYDMNKLFIRSLGTLGIVTEVTFKLLPMPARRAAVIAHFPGAEGAWAVVGRILASFLLPDALEFLDEGAVARMGGPAGTCALAVALSGSAETVDRQVRDFAAFFKDGGGYATILQEDEAVTAWAGLRDLLEGGADPIRCRIAVPISAAAGLAAAAAGLSRQAGLQAAVVAGGGTGIVRALFTSGPETRAPEVAMALEGLRREAEAAEGSLVLEAAPASLKARLDAWGAPAGGLDMMRRLKHEFDPLGLFNPGRFVAGI
jgi:glycolate oxidase FAD binding subunit